METRNPILHVRARWLAAEGTGCSRSSSEALVLTCRPLMLDWTSSGRKLAPTLSVSSMAALSGVVSLLGGVFVELLFLYEGPRLSG